jgi:hypothetical protein
MISSNYCSISSEGLVYFQWHKDKYCKLERTPIQELLFENCQIEPGTLVYDVWRLYEKYDLLGKIFNLSNLTCTDEYVTLPDTNRYLSIRWDAVFYPNAELFDEEADVVLQLNEGITNDFEYHSTEELLSYKISTDPTFNVLEDKDYNDPTQLIYGQKDFRLIDILHVFYKQIILDSQGELNA